MCGTGWTIHEEREVCVDRRADCVILGGGIAGVSAALACARTGAKTLLIEKGILPGGLATAGFINKFLPICDGYGKKVCGGIAEELLRETVRYGYDTLPEDWRTGEKTGNTDARYMTVFSPFDFVMALDEALEQAGVEVLYDALFVDAVREGERCTVAILESKRGRHAVEAKVFVDCTGDADLAFRMGAACEEVGNWLSYWAYVTAPGMMRRGAQDASVLHGVPLWEKGSTWDGKNVRQAAPDYSPLSPEEITRFVTDGRRLFRAELAKHPGERPVITALPTMAQMRMTRRLRGHFELSSEHVNRCFLDSIGCAPDWRTRGRVYEIPYGALFADDMRNVLVAGRCVSSGADAWEVTRAIPGCAVTGQAAGCAAAMAAAADGDVRALEIGRLQARLARDGAILHVLRDGGGL